MSYGFTITNKGWSLLAKLIAGGSLELTKIMVGKGRTPDDVSPATLTDLIDPVALATSTIPLVKDNTVSFIVEYRSDLNGGLEEGFWLYEFGVYAMDPDEGEIMLYFATLGDFPQYVSPYNNGSVDIRRFPITIVLTSELEVTIAYPPLAFMTAEDVHEYCMTIFLPLILENIAIHNVHPEAHPDIRDQIDLLFGLLTNTIAGSTSFVVTFDSLDGIEIIEGILDLANRRIYA